ncbi:MAG: tape measure protein [Bacteroidales bacterium]|nr:tape measure protein [Bacteroidales bacterium]
MTTYEYTMRLKDKASKTMGKIGAKGKKTYGTLSSETERLNKKMGFLNNSIVRVGGSMALLYGGTKIVEAGMNVEKVRKNFQILQKSVEKGNETFNRLNNYVQNSVFQLDEVRNSGKKLVTVTDSADELLTRMRQIGDISAGSGARIEELSNAYVKAAAKGKLQGEVFEMFTDRGIPIVQELAKMFDTTTQGVYKMGEKGELGVKELNAVIERMTGKTGNYYRANEKLMETASGSLSALKSQWQALLEKVGSQQNTFFANLFGNLSKAVKWMGENIEVWTKWLKWIIVITGAIVAYRKTIQFAKFVQLAYNVAVRKANVKLYILNKRLLGASNASGVYSGLMGIATGMTKAFTWAVKGLTSAIYNIPIIGWILLGISLLAKAFHLLWQKSLGFRKVIWGLWEMLKASFSGLFKAVGSAFQWINKNIFTPIGNFFKKIWDWVTDLATAIAKPFENIKGIFREVFTWFRENISGPISKFFGKLWSKISDNKAYKKGVAKAEKSWENDHSSKQKSEKANKYSSGMSVADKNKFIDTDYDNYKTLDLTNTGGSGGTTSKKVRQVTINLQSLVESLTINTATLEEATDELEERVTEALLRALNSGNSMQNG